MGDTDVNGVGASLIPSADMYASLLRGEASDGNLPALQMLRLLMDATTNAAWWKDLDSRFLVCNRVLADFAGISPDLMVGKSDRDMPWADDTRFSAEWFIEWDRHVVESGEPYFGIVEQLRRADGEHRWLETNKMPIRDQHGRVVGTLGTFADITERLRAEDELRETLSDLDQRVQSRTAQLQRTNETLRREIDDRVRLQAEERQLRAYAEGLRDTASAMATSFDPDEVIDRTIEGVERLVSNDSVVVVVLNDDEETAVHRKFGFGYDADHLTSRLSPLERDCLRSVSSGRVAVVNQVQSNDERIASAICARMQIGSRTVGYLIAKSTIEGFYIDSHAERLSAVADLAASAVSNAQLAVRTSELAAIEERQRLARELHDAINQTLWTAALTAETLRDEIDPTSEMFTQAERLCELTRGGLAEMRSLLLELRPSALARVSLKNLIEHLVSAIESRRKITAVLHLDDVVVGADEHLTFYRVAQEAIGNVVQHASAATLTVHLRQIERVGTEDAVTELIVSDDGCGFDLDEIEPGHLGVDIMRERADLLGAELSIQSAVGEGTTVSIRKGALSKHDVPT